MIETDAGDCRAEIRYERGRLFRELDLSNLTVHVVDSSGLRTCQLEPGQISAGMTWTISPASRSRPYWPKAASSPCWASNVRPRLETDAHRVEVKVARKGLTVQALRGWLVLQRNAEGRGR